MPVSLEAEPDSQLFLGAFPWFFLLALPSAEVVAASVIIIFLLFCSALVSGSEVAFFSLNHKDFEKLAQDERGAGARILDLARRPRELLATILISNNFINIAIVILSDFVLRRVISVDTFLSWSKAIAENTMLNLPVEKFADIISFIIAVVGVTFMLVLFGEVSPKVYAKLNNIRLAKLMSLPLVILVRVFSPLSGILVKWTNFIEARLARSTAGGSPTSRQDIDEAIELTVSGEEDTEQDVDILKSIVKFGDVSVKQIMRSRVDVVAVDYRISYKELLKVVRESEYSRIPVFDEDFDHVTGILYVKDLLGHLNEEEEFEWQKLIRTDLLYVPEAKKIDDLLKEFQKKHLHMAIVVDEYGGSSGIVTLEDILEEIIGDIKDEFDDEPEVIYKQIDDYNFIFEGKTLLNDTCRILGLDTSTFDEVRGEADSLAGLILEILGEFPKDDDEVHYNQFRFKIVSVSERRIEQILITLPKE